MTVEPVLLEKARAMIGQIPFDEIDVLIVGELGKNYSGAGIDPNVVGRLLIEAAPVLETNRPKITRMAVLDVSPESHGNATGVGIADLTTNRLIASINQTPFRMNNLTACFLWRSKLPFAFETDLEVLKMAIQTCWQPIRRRSTAWRSAPSTSSRESGHLSFVAQADWDVRPCKAYGKPAWSPSRSPITTPRCGIPRLKVWPSIPQPMPQRSLATAGRSL